VVLFDGHDPPRAFRECRREPTRTRADFQHGILRSGVERVGDPREEARIT
jgi:hypothetical protein